MLVGTQLREAVNVWPLEYVYSRHLRGLPAGVLVLSEFSGFARVLNGGLRVNPNSQKAALPPPSPLSSAPPPPLPGA